MEVKEELSDNISNIVSKQTETEKLISAEHSNLILKFESTIKMIEEEKKKIMNLEMKLAALVSESVRVSNERKQNLMKIYEAKDAFVNADSELDKTQTKSLKAEMILLKEEHTIKSYQKEMDSQSNALKPFCENLDSNKIIKTLEKNKVILQEEQSNLNLKIDKIKNNYELQKERLEMDTKIASNRILALKKKLKKKIT